MPGRGFEGIVNAQESVFPVSRPRTKALPQSFQLLDLRYAPVFNVESHQVFSGNERP